ncbi:hypothetical protein J6590_071827 [Homalodisca vitripennis]|nr:hypothetical protein J6590_071827 [Homalodisca vitripennis]
MLGKCGKCDTPTNTSGTQDSIKCDKCGKVLHLQCSDLRYIHRTVKKNHFSLCHPTRAEWMEVAKSKKALDAIHLSSRFETSPVYVNDSVHQFITVLNQAKKMVREQLAYAWVKEGKQLVMTETDGLVKV